MSELEAACRKCVHLVVSNVKALSKVLDEIGLEYTILSNNEADVFGEINITKLVTKLSGENCEVLSMQEHDESHAVPFALHWRNHDACCLCRIFYTDCNGNP